MLLLVFSSQDRPSFRLIQAASDGDLETVESIIKNNENIDVNATNEASSDVVSHVTFKKNL